MDTAPRVTETEVIAIMDTAMTPEEVQPHLEAAHIAVDYHLLNRDGYTPSVLEQVEKYLAAHIATVTRDRRRHAYKEKIGEAEIQYSSGGKDGFGLHRSSYGEMVKLLDKDGILAALDKASTPVSIEVIA